MLHRHCLAPAPAVVAPSTPAPKKAKKMTAVQEIKNYASMQGVEDVDSKTLDENSFLIFQLLLLFIHTP